MKPIDDDSWWIAGARARMAQRWLRLKVNCARRRFGFWRWWNRRGDIGQAGIAQVVTLGTGIIAGTAAMINFLQQSGTTKRDFLVWIYLPAVLIPIAFLLMLIFLRVHDGAKSRFYFDWPTRFSGGCAFVVSALAVSLVVVFGWQGLLPGQEPRGPIAFNQIYERKGKDAVPRIEAAFALDRKAIPDGPPEYLILVFSVKPPMIERWSIEAATLFEEPTTGRARAVQILHPGPGVDSAYFPAVFPKPLDRSVKYRVQVTLAPTARKIEQSYVAEALVLVKDGNGLTAMDASAR